MKLQLLKLIVKENNERRIEVPLTFSLGISDESKMYIIKIKKFLNLL